MNVEVLSLRFKKPTAGVLKAQASVEQLIMLGIGLAILGILAYIASTIANDNGKAALANYAVQKLATASDFANSMGPGSKTVVDIYVPKNVQFLNTTGKRVVMRVGMSTGEVDFFANTEADLIGSLSLSEGRTIVTIEKLGDGRVMVGENGLACSPSRISTSIVQGGSDSAIITVQNSGATQLTGLHQYLLGNVEEMTVMDSVPDTLNPGASANINLNFAVDADKQAGVYSGILVINGTPASECSTSIGLVVTSSSAEDSEGPSASAPTYTPNTPTNEDSIQAYATCDDSGSGNGNIAKAELEIDYSGIWNTMNPDDGSYGSSTVLDVAYAVGTLTGGNHYLSVRCTDSVGNVGSSSTTALYVDGPIEDSTGPLVYSLAYSPEYINTLNSIVINATGDDRDTGNGNVSSCQLELDWSNLWSTMTALGGTYGTAPVLNLGYNLGLLPAGEHTVRVRCMDTYGNVGAAAMVTFTVHAPDYEGPVVNFITYTPESPTTADKVEVVATADDSGTGNSSIAYCELMQDSMAWIQMLPDGSANSVPVQNYTLNLGMLSSGTHTLIIRCADSQGNVGNESNVTVSVNRELLFMHYGLNTAENYWINWINSHNSAEGFQWKMDVKPWGDVNSGAVNISKYKAVVIARSLSSQSDKKVYINHVTPYKNSGHYVVLLGQALLYGLGKLSIAGTPNSASGSQVKVKASHYVTTGYPLNSLQSVTTNSNSIYYATGTSMTNVAEQTGAAGRGTVLDGSNVITYGEYRPDRHTAVGDAIATRIIDYALLNSK